MSFYVINPKNYYLIRFSRFLIRFLRNYTANHHKKTKIYRSVQSCRRSTIKWFWKNIFSLVYETIYYDNLLQKWIKLKNFTRKPRVWSKLPPKLTRMAPTCTPGIYGWRKASPIYWRREHIFLGNAKGKSLLAAALTLTLWISTAYVNWKWDKLETCYCRQSFLFCWGRWNWLRAWHILIPFTWTNKRTFWWPILK